jgi:hypothetical protein
VQAAPIYFAALLEQWGIPANEHIVPNVGCETIQAASVFFVTFLQAATGPVHVVQLGVLKAGARRAAKSVSPCHRCVKALLMVRNPVLEDLDEHHARRAQDRFHRVALFVSTARQGGQCIAAAVSSVATLGFPAILRKITSMPGRHLGLSWTCTLMSQCVRTINQWLATT